MTVQTFYIAMLSRFPNFYLILFFSISNNTTKVVSNRIKALTQKRINFPKRNLHRLKSKHDFNATASTAKPASNFHKPQVEQNRHNSCYRRTLPVTRFTNCGNERLSKDSDTRSNSNLCWRRHHFDYRCSFYRMHTFWSKKCAEKSAVKNAAATFTALHRRMCRISFTTHAADLGLLRRD